MLMSRLEVRSFWVSIFPGIRRCSAARRSCWPWARWLRRGRCTWSHRCWCCRFRSRKRCDCRMPSNLRIERYCMWNLAIVVKAMSWANHWLVYWPQHWGNNKGPSLVAVLWNHWVVGTTCLLYIFVNWRLSFASLASWWEKFCVSEFRKFVFAFNNFFIPKS